MRVYHVIGAIFYVQNVSFSAIRENKFSRKFPNLQYCILACVYLTVCSSVYSRIYDRCISCSVLLYSFVP